MLLLTLLALPALAAEPSTKAELPTPETFIMEDTISLAVVQARPQDQGFKALLDAAWEGFGGVTGENANTFFRIVLKAIQGENSNALMSFLPAQIIRADALGADGLPYPTLAVTVAGWTGLQNIFYTGMGTDSSGKKYPTRDTEAATLILREGWKDPSRSHILTRMKGTFMSFPTVEKAEQVVTRFDKGETNLPTNQFVELLSQLDRQADTYGVVINRNGSLMKFLRWFNKADTNRIAKSVGPERMAEVMAGVQSMSFTGDLVNENEMHFLVTFRTDSPKTREELTDVLKEARDVLEQYGRAGELQLSGLRNDVLVDFKMLGYKDMMKSYVEYNFK